MGVTAYLGPKCRLCRREGVKLFLKGSRCFSDKCAIIRRQQAPGQHGTYTRRISEYGKQLREKQKVKRIYGVSETQFRNYYEKAERKRGITGELLLQMLERRLDNVIYRLGLAHSRRHARILVGQGKFSLNGKKVNIPSILVSAGDKIALVNEKGVPMVEEREVPNWLKWSKSKKEGTVLRLPERKDVDMDINEQLIIEFYSR